MVPKVSKKGSSFKGAALYYLHDKEAATSERVAWTETVNFATDDPDQAWRIMAATALNQEALKAAAGIKNTGRKSNLSVLSYALNWHPSEKPDQAEMSRAARETLKVLGAEDHQAIIACHTDRPHAHVHVIVNRVNPRDGRMLSSSNDQLKLSQWAEAYERDQRKIWCEQRVRNNQARQVRGDFVRAAREIPRPVYADQKAAQKTAANDNERKRTEGIRDEQRRKDAELARAAREMHERHRRQWREAVDSYRRQREDIRRSAEERIEAARREVHDRHRPAWRDLHARQEEQRRRFDDREARILGKVRNMLDAVAHRRVSEHSEADRNWLAATFNVIHSQQGRRSALDKAQGWERGLLAGKVRADTRAAIAPIKEDRAARLGEAARVFQDTRQTVIERQEAERQGLREAWKSHTQDRREAWRGYQAERQHGRERQPEKPDATQSRGRGYRYSRSYRPGGPN